MFQHIMADKIFTEFVPKGPVNDILALVRIMAWCRPGDNSLSEPIRINSGLVYGRINVPHVAPFTNMV